MTGRWLRCTPAWVATYNACGATVRRMVMVPTRESSTFAGVFRPEQYEAVGHEHLMVVLPGNVLSPLPHESGEPA